MLHTDLHDDRDRPAHAFKFAARLEVEAPCLLRVEKKSGYSRATLTTKIEEYSDIMVFVYKLLKVEEQI
jgi:prolyl oligopeptidase PreP (S9A serine peptidase family)